MKRFNSCTLAVPGTLQWKKEFKRALKNPSFHYTPPKDLDKLIELPDPPKKNHKGKITKYNQNQYEVACRKITKVNALKLFILEAVKEHNNED